MAIQQDGVRVVPLRRTALVLPETYPRFTLVGQAWGAVRLGHEALSKLVPEVCGRSDEVWRGVSRCGRTVTNVRYFIKLHL